jgi:hypothetical protein
MGRQKRDRKHSSPQNNLIQDSQGNEENGYLQFQIPENKDRLF